jgi:hypothetical protein
MDTKLDLPNRAAEEWRRSAARREDAGEPVTALYFRNLAYWIEHPGEKIGGNIPPGP